MNANITSIVVNGKTIEVKNGYVLIICGNGPTDGAFYKKLEDCTDTDFAAAKEVQVSTENKVENNTNAPVYKVDNSDFDRAVDFLTRCSGEDFLELVKYAKKHDNTFFRCVKEVAECVNADDTYCTAIIKFTRHLVGEEIERKAFELLSEAEKDDYDFIKFWEALQTINYFCN